MGLDLNTAPRTSVFRKLVSLIKNDATIKRVLSKPVNLRVWDGGTSDTEPFGPAFAPCVRLTPTSGADSWWSPGATRGPLFIQVEMIVQGTNADDMMNLWWAIVRAIYPAAQSSTNANIQALQQAGAYTGMAEFTLPAMEADPKNSYFAAQGQIKIEVNNVILAG